MNFRKMVATAVVAAGGLWAAAAQAEETVVWWDFLGGGDGVRMKQLITDFNAGPRRQGQDRRHDAGMGHALLRQGADLGRRRRGGRRHDLSRQPHPAGGEPGYSRRDHRRRHEQDGPVGLRLRPGDHGRRDGRRQAIRGAARYPSNRALLQPRPAEEGRRARRRRPSHGHGQQGRIHRHAAEVEGRRRRVPAGQRHRRRQLHVPHHLFADVPAGRRTDDRRRVPDRRQRRQA